QFDPAVTDKTALAATAQVSGVQAAVGPFETVSAELAVGQMHLARAMTVVGRQDQAATVDRLTLDSGHWPTGAGPIVLARGRGGPIVRVGDTATVTAGESTVALQIVGIAYSVTGTADAWVWPTQSDILHPTVRIGQPHTGLQMLYRFDSAADNDA